ncbi:hypothetical protein JD844_027452 [Phrynosoma platyrhinos]|uniref:DDE Tnp4 domain-containing protein n=1 Tax=Phrynosoma platyrhinos TaxID=52577 RepID=A0ABQ7SGC2_PHRPL|nr:hypothetical protein JD844_027452 [Phrynosoma platyrhinos]
MIVEELLPQLIRQDIHLCRALSVEKRVAIAVYFLADKGFYVTIATIFGVGKSTASRAIIQVVIAMELMLLKKTVYLGDYRKVIAGFETKGFPQVIEAVDGCHCNLISPVYQSSQFIKRKQRYPMLLQGTCDHSGRFIDLVTGWARSNYDSFVFRSSPVYDTLRAGAYVPRKPTVTIFGRQVGPLLLADVAYPIKPWVMTPFKSVLRPCQAVYNKHLNRHLPQRAYNFSPKEDYMVTLRHVGDAKLPPWAGEVETDM